MGTTSDQKAAVRGKDRREKKVRHKPKERVERSVVGREAGQIEPACEEPRMPQQT